MHIPIDLDIYPANKITCLRKDATELYVIAKDWEQPKFPSVGNSLNKYKYNLQWNTAQLSKQ